MTEQPKIALIWAQASNGVIGIDGDMPWYLPEDFAHFKASTLGCPVIMGRTTWESLPDQSRPLPGRVNIVLSRDPQYAATGATVVDSVATAIDTAADAAKVSGSSTIWVIGGGNVYEQFMPYAHTLSVTHVNLNVDGDTLAPHIPQTFRLASRMPDEGWNLSRTDLEYAFLTYEQEGQAA